MANPPAKVVVYRLGGAEWDSGVGERFEGASDTMTQPLPVYFMAWKQEMGEHKRHEKRNVRS